jgi:hypothetical protein
MTPAGSAFSGWFDGVRAVRKGFDDDMTAGGKWENKYYLVCAEPFGAHVVVVYNHFIQSFLHLLAVIIMVVLQFLFVIISLFSYGGYGGFTGWI